MKEAAGKVSGRQPTPALLLCLLCPRATRAPHEPPALPPAASQPRGCSNTKIKVVSVVIFYYFCYHPN